MATSSSYAAHLQVQIRGGRHSVRSVHASADGTFLLKANGRVLACGSNECNKLGLNCAAKGLRKHKQEVGCTCRVSQVIQLVSVLYVCVSDGYVHVL